MTPNRHITKLQLLHRLARLAVELDAKRLSTSLEWQTSLQRGVGNFAKLTVTQWGSAFHETLLFTLPMYTQEVEKKIDTLLTKVGAVTAAGGKKAKKV